ncbi:MAG: CAP domain-containing protein [Nitrososphaerales archaeon]
MKIGDSRRRSALSEWQTAEPAPSSHAAAAVLLVALVLLAAFVLVAANLPAVVKDGSDLVSQLLSSFNGPTGANTTESLNYTVYSPLIQNGAANISYPSDYGALSSYVLSLVNSDRANYSVGPVGLGDGAYAQQHADSMLEYGYFSHNDTQGFKPYMRYTLLGGRGAVEENVAYAYASFPLFTSTSAVEGQLKALEWTMVYNDSQCCNDGHRYNILSSLHNQVSVGVAYSSTRVYFVEDFENYYIDLNFSVSDSYYVTMTGTPLISGLSADAVYVTYDQTPAPETPAQLNSGPHEYSEGLLVGGVLPPCILACQTFASIITVRADTWVFTSDQVAVDFSLSDFIQQYGAGVYTVYLTTGADTSSAITSISVFVG